MRSKWFWTSFTEWFINCWSNIFIGLILEIFEIFWENYLFKKESVIFLLLQNVFEFREIRNCLAYFHFWSCFKDGIIIQFFDNYRLVPINKMVEKNSWILRSKLDSQDVFESKCVLLKYYVNRNIVLHETPYVMLLIS